MFFDLAFLDWILQIIVSAQDNSCLGRSLGSPSGQG